MKRNKSFLTLIAVTVGAALPVLAQDKPAEVSGYRSQRNESEARQISGLGHVEKATKITGMEIRDAEDRKLGHVKDLAIDLEHGRIVEVLVSSGGVLGVGGKTVAIPPGAFTEDPAKKGLRLDVDQNKFKDAPEFDMSKWESSFDAGQVGTVYSYYGKQGYFAGHPTELGHVERAGKLIGLAVKNNQGDSLGDVENLLVDLPAGRVVVVVVASGGFLGIGDELSVAPPHAFQFNRDQDNLRLEATKETMMNAPHFKSNHWPEDSSYYSSAYQAYHVTPYFGPDSSVGAEYGRNGAGGLNPLDQGNNKEDLERTRQIRKEIIADKNLSVDAHNVKIITIGGKVTLRGTVENEEEKQRIGEIANRIAENRNVENQLEISKATINR